MVASADASRADNPHVARTVLDDKDISRAMTRITHEILERNRGSADIVLLGIPTRGVHLARRIAKRTPQVSPLRSSCLSTCGCSPGSSTWSRSPSLLEMAP